MHAMHFFYALELESLPEILLSLDTEIWCWPFSSSLAGLSKQTSKLGHEKSERYVIYLWVNVTSDRSNQDFLVRPNRIKTTVICSVLVRLPEALISAGPVNPNGSVYH